MIFAVQGKVWLNFLLTKLPHTAFKSAVLLKWQNSSAQPPKSKFFENKQLQKDFVFYFIPCISRTWPFRIEKLPKVVNTPFL